MVKTTYHSPKVKLCFIIAQLEGDGAERQLLALVQGLDPGEFEVHVGVLTDALDLAPELINAGAKVICFHKKRQVDLVMLTSLYVYLRRGRFDIVQTILSTANLWGRMAAIAAKIPVIIASERNVEDWKSSLLLFSDRILACRTTLILANSRAVQDFVVRTTGISPSRCKLIYNGIDLNRFQPGLQAKHEGEIIRLQEQLKIAGGNTVIGTIGRLTEQKDHDTFLRACHLLDNEAPDCHFVIVGDGPEETKLKALTKELGLDSQVTFTGRLHDVASVIPLFDIFVLSSRREGFANVILEAMALGKPVVATDVGGNAEAVVHGETGYIVPPESPVALCQALLSLIRNQEAARRMGTAGRKRAQHLYETSKMVEATAEVYENLMKVEPSRKFGY
jgi:glycosyltransferase involved in cell wall biosynthesis